MNECIFHKLAVKNVNVNVVKTIYCQRNSIFLAKKFFVFIFDRPESGFVWAKKYLVGHHDGRPAVHYFQPGKASKDARQWCNSWLVLNLLCLLLTQKTQKNGTCSAGYFLLVKSN